MWGKPTIECVCPCGSLFVGDVSLSSSVVPECSVAEDRLPEEIDASDPVSVLPNKWPCYEKGDNTLCHIYLNVICFKVRENWIKG